VLGGKRYGLVDTASPIHQARFLLAPDCLFRGDCRRLGTAWLPSFE
jgi:hypothetical protein